MTALQNMVVRLHQRYCRPWMLRLAWTGYALCVAGMVYVVLR